MSSTEDEELRPRKLEEALEVKSLRRILSAYLNYPEASEVDIRRYERCFKRMPPAHKVLLSHLPLKFQKLRWCVAQNSYFIFEMLKAFDPPIDMSVDTYISDDKIMEDVIDSQLLSGKRNPIPFQSVLKSNDLCQTNEDKVGSKEGMDGARGYSEPEPLAPSSPDWLDPSVQLPVPLGDVDKVRCIIRNIVRDWAAEGQCERDECYKPILDELKRLFPRHSGKRPPTCLVPGAGLGRLALEISSLGFVSQGNEFSYYMMICSSFLLNHSYAANEWTIYPWIHNSCNSVSDNDQLRSVSIPDIHPASAGITEGFSMCGGDFVEVYSDSSHVGAWDAVATCFFIDTAHNIIEYIEIISRIVKDGGVWINLGPLLYHFADSYTQDDEMSIELSLEDVKTVAYHYGFEIEIDDAESILRCILDHAKETTRSKSAKLKALETELCLSEFSLFSLCTAPETLLKYGKDTMRSTVDMVSLLFCKLKSLPLKNDCKPPGREGKNMFSLFQSH